MKALHHHSQGLGMASEKRRLKLLQELRDWGIRDERVLAAIGKVPRHEFLDEALKSRAYENNALPIGHGQTISQPYIVARMTEALLNGSGPPATIPRNALTPPPAPQAVPPSPAARARDSSRPSADPPQLRRVLEVGTGCGYQAAVLAELVPAVFSVERIKKLSEQARARLARLQYHNVLFSYADGVAGWPTYAPYDGILVAAATSEVPQALLDQLAPGGRLVLPVGPSGAQLLRLIERTDKGLKSSDLGGVSFVPLLPGRS